MERQEDQHLNITLPQQFKVETYGKIGALRTEPSDGLGGSPWSRILWLLRTTEYETRDVFLERFAFLLDVTKQVFAPEPATRIGLRYVNRLVGPPLARLADFVRSPVLGLLDTPLGSYATFSLSETLFRSPPENAHLRLRQAFLPTGASIDPTIAPPIGEPSWLLDLDMSDGTHRPFDVAALASRSRSYAERVYSVFRELVTEEFLRYHGGAA